MAPNQLDKKIDNSSKMPKIVLVQIIAILLVVCVDGILYCCMPNDVNQGMLLGIGALTFAGVNVFFVLAIMCSGIEAWVGAGLDKDLENPNANPMAKKLKLCTILVYALVVVAMLVVGFCEAKDHVKLSQQETFYMVVLFSAFLVGALVLVGAGCLIRKKNAAESQRSIAAGK